MRNRKIVTDNYSEPSRSIAGAGEHQSGQKLGAYLFTPSSTGYEGQIIPIMVVTLSSSDQYFGGRRLAPMDQLGSVVNSSQSYFPWGETKGTSNPQDTWNFATYWQDSNTGLDYANNRYYSNAYGRFMTPDPYTNSGRLTDPQSWNRYAYTRGDPVNRYDPSGTDDSAPYLCPVGAGEGTELVECFNVTVYAGMNPSPLWGPAIEAATSAMAQYGAAMSALQQFLTVADASANTKKVDATLGQLRNALSSDPKCLNFLESGIAGNNLSVFNQYFNALDGASGGPALAVAQNFQGTQYQGLNGLTSSYAILINSSGAFFSSAVGVGYAGVYANQVQSIQGGTPEAQYFILLHELAHFFQAQGFIQNDGNSLGAQQANNDLLWKDCSKTIQSVGGGTVF
jgi:RHS repeat-associated protein